MQVSVPKVEAAAVDERWSFVGSKRQPRWLWHAMDHHTGQVCASVCGTREDVTCFLWPERFVPCGIRHFDPDGWGASRRHIDPDQSTVGTPQTPKIARQHTTLRARITRVVRKPICFAPSIQMHDRVLGFCIHPCA